MRSDPAPGRISSSNRSFRLARALREPEGIRENAAFLLEGRRFVADVLSRRPDLVSELLVSEAFHGEDLPEFAGRVSLVPDHLFPRISDTVSSQGIVAVCRIPVHDLSSCLSGQGPCVVPVLDGVSDPGNAGTLIRTAAAFGCPAVLVTTGGCEAFSPKVTRASAGANVFLPVFQRIEPGEIASMLKALGFTLLASEPGGSSVLGEARGTRVALVIGSEAGGISPAMRALCDKAVSIPMPGGIESLNAAVAGAILMFWLSGKAGI